MTIEEKFEFIQLLITLESSSRILAKTIRNSMISSSEFEPSSKELKAYHSHLDFHITLQADIMQRMPKEVTVEWLRKGRSSN